MIRVLIADDQALVRSGFRVILETEPDIEVVGEAADGVEAVELAAALAPDVICMDVEMPRMDGIEASRRILAHGQGEGSASILVLTTFGHEEYLFDALAAGVSGFLLKTSRAEQLVDAVRALAAGQALLGPDVTRVVMERATGAGNGPGAGGPRVGGPGVSGPDAGGPDAGGLAAEAGAQEGRGGADRGGAAVTAMTAAGLTEREREVLGLVARGLSNAEIAGDLFLGEATVKTHVSNILQKLGARDRIQLVVWAYANGVRTGS